MKLVIASLLISGTAVAAGGDGPGSLVPAATNVTILACVLIYFLRLPAKQFFSSKSSTVSEMLERATSKAKEAEMMMDVQKKKILGAEDEINKIKADADKTIVNFGETYKAEVAERIVKMKEDAAQKIEAEKKELVDELNSKLLDLVIEKAKTQMKTDKALADNATKNIIQGL